MLYKDRVKETTTTTGTGNITTAGAVTGFITFNTAFGTGASNTFQYVIDSSGGSEWEVGVGYMSASTTLVRETILASSNSNAAVSFSSGTKNVRCTAAAKYFEQQTIQLLSSTVVDASVGTKQTLYTVPTGKKCVPAWMTIRSATGSMAAYAGVLSLGFNAGADNIHGGLASEYIGLLTSAAVGVQIALEANSTSNTFTIGNAADVLGCIFTDTAVNQDVTVDIFGYLYDA